MEEPSRAGLTIRDADKLSICAGCTSTWRGTGRPSACQTRLVMTLSMAMLDAITPDPVYGMPHQLQGTLHRAVFAITACKAMKQRWNPSF